MGCTKSNSNREVPSDTGLPKETKISKKQSNFTHKGTRKRRTKKPKASKRKEIIKIRANISKIEKMNKTKNGFFGKIKKIDKL